MFYLHISKYLEAKLDKNASLSVPVLFSTLFPVFGYVVKDNPSY